MRETRKLLLIPALVLVLAAGCGEADDEPAGDGGDPQTTAQQATETPEATDQQAGETTARQATEAPEQAAGEPGGEGATLRLEGEPGTPFSGTCTVDGVEEDLEGEVPEVFTYEVDRSLECEVRALDPDAGSLRTVFTSADGTTRSTQQVSGAQSTISFTYSGGSFSSSVSSGTGS